MTEEQVLACVRAHIGSVYTLELLLLLKQGCGKAWLPEDLVRELRSSKTAVTEALSRLSRAGLVSEDAGRYFFAPSSPDREQFASEIEKLYTVKPLSVVKAIMAEPSDRLRAFSDAFKLKE